VQVLQVRDDVGVGEQGLHLAGALVATGKHQLRGHGRPLNADAGGRRGSECGSHGEAANSYQEHS
jgi:hypothetical protein